MKGLEICEAERADAPAIAEIYLTARRDAMPYLNSPHTDDEIRAYFGHSVGDRPSAWWLARLEEQIVGYVLIDGENLDHLYVRPEWQRHGIGLSSEFARQPFEGGRCRMLRGGQHSQHGAALAVGAQTPSPAEDAFAVLPQAWKPSSPPAPNQDGFIMRNPPSGRWPPLGCEGYSLRVAKPRAYHSGNRMTMSVTVTSATS